MRLLRRSDDGKLHQENAGEKESGLITRLPRNLLS